MFRARSLRGGLAATTVAVVACGCLALVPAAAQARQLDYTASITGGYQFRGHDSYWTSYAPGFCTIQDYQKGRWDATFHSTLPVTITVHSRGELFQPSVMPVRVKITSKNTDFYDHTGDSTCGPDYSADPVTCADTVRHLPLSLFADTAPVLAPGQPDDFASAQNQLTVGGDISSSSDCYQWQPLGGETYAQDYYPRHFLEPVVGQEKRQKLLDPHTDQVVLKGLGGLTESGVWHDEFAPSHPDTSWGTDWDAAYTLTLVQNG